MKALKITLAILICLIVVYIFGPRMPRPNFSSKLPPIACSTNQLDNYIHEKEKQLGIKHDNQSRIIWQNDTLKQPTNFALLYLHGFSASWYEGEPSHRLFAKTTNMNAYFPRLATHGINTENALMEMTPDTLYQSAKEALMIARKLGRQVIIMSTSTGGTLSLKLAAHFPKLVHSLILYSPNIAINDASAFILDKPWGLQIARKVLGSNYRELTPKDSIDSKYWYNKYRIESLVYLQQLVSSTMTEKTFRKIKCPLFLGYYYKDEKHQDQVVKVDAMLKMFDQIATPSRLKQKHAFPEANTHVIANGHFSSTSEQVLKQTLNFWHTIQHHNK